MALNLNQIAVRPVLFLAQDHRSRNMSLIFDQLATDRFHIPHPDREGVLIFKADPFGMTITTFTSDLDPIRPQIILETSSNTTLAFSFGSEFAEVFGPGGFAAWSLNPQDKSNMRRHETQKSKPFSLLGVVVQGIETPDVNHTIFLTEECRNRWYSWYGSDKFKVLPQFDIEFSVVRFADPPMTFNIKLAVREQSTGEFRYLHSSTRMKIGESKIPPRASI
jgi:hypothetical protein